MRKQLKKLVLVGAVMLVLVGALGVSTASAKLLEEAVLGVSTEIASTLPSMLVLVAKNKPKPTPTPCPTPTPTPNPNNGCDGGVWRPH